MLWRLLTLKKDLGAKKGTKRDRGAGVSLCMLRVMKKEANAVVDLYPVSSTLSCVCECVCVRVRVCMSLLLLSFLAPPVSKSFFFLILPVQSASAVLSYSSLTRQ